MFQVAVMVDVVDKAARSRMMAGIRGQNTQPELLLRRLLHRKGFRFSLRSKNLPGRPDIVLPRYDAVIFVHGCFWHRHAGCAYTTNPGTRIDFWTDKFRKNVERDERVTAELLSEGWRVFTVWECGLRHQADEVAERLSRLLKVKSCLKYELPELPPKRTRS